MNICVFSSSSNGINQAYFNEAKKLGELMVKNGHSLINGGANVGLMEALSATVNDNGGETIGIIPERMEKRNLISENSRQVILTKDMKERKAKMRALADAFIALPGGFGTLEEILEVLTLKQLAYHNKPVIFINTLNFFEHLMKQFEKTFEENFAKQAYRHLYFVAKNAEEAMQYIKNYQPADLGLKWFHVPK